MKEVKKHVTYKNVYIFQDNPLNCAANFDVVYRFKFENNFAMEEVTYRKADIPNIGCNPRVSIVIAFARFTLCVEGDSRDFRYCFIALEAERFKVSYKIQIT